MQRHRAGRLAVLLSLNKIDSKPDGVARTACISPGAHGAIAQNEGSYQRTPSTVGLLAPSASEKSMEGSENEGLCQNFTSGGESQPSSDTMRPTPENDSGLEMSIDIIQAANVLRLEGINEECSSASDDSGIQVKVTGLGRESPSNNVCTKPPCGVEPNGAACDQSCVFGQDAAQIASAAQLVRRPSNDYLDAPDCVYYKGDTHRTKWEEAAIFIKEGEGNEKFNHHPKGRWSKLAFKILHHPAYYITHLIVTILLMLLALAENYPTPRNGRQISDEAMRSILVADKVLESLFLFFIAIYILLKLTWFGPRQFITSKTSVFSTIVLIVMVLEAIIVLARQRSHIHVTRALRPVFIIDNVLMDGVRRELRDIIKSLKPIVDVLFLLLFIVFVFALLGYYIFAEVDPSFFDSFKKSFISLFILMTTSNNPDVMLESYFEHPGSAIYFFLYLIVTVYFITNVLLAVVYSSFSDAEMLKFKELYLHKRDALRLAYNMLKSPEGVTFHDFLQFVQCYRPRLADFEVMCMFKALHTDTTYVGQHQPISREEFYNFYEVQDMRWKEVHNNQKVPWFEKVRILKACQLPIKTCHRIVKSKLFNAIVYLIVLINVIGFAVYALVVDDCPPAERFMKLRGIYAASVIFNLIYCAEIVLKIIGFGPHHYYRKPWNVIDTLIVAVSLVCLLLETNSKLAFLALVRPIKLFRLLRLKRKYRDIMSTIVYLAPKMLTVGIFLVIVHYFFAIIGLEFFNGRVFQGCCNDSWYGIGAYFTGIISENTTENVNPSPDIYYILNFDDIGSSYATLFTLMIVNNWHIIMEGYASEFDSKVDWLVRLYFLSFNIITLVIFEVVISFIVEAFVFKILTRQRSRMCVTHHKPYYQCKCTPVCDRKKKVEITLVQEDLDVIKHEHKITHIHSTIFTIGLSQFVLRPKLKENLPQNSSKTYIGKRPKTKDDIQLQMYRPLLPEWIRVAEAIKKAKEAKRSRKETQPMRAVMSKYLTYLYEYITD